LDDVPETPDRQRIMDLAQLIDHTLLKPTCTSADVEQICNEALKHKFAAVCLPPFYVKDAHHILENSTTKVAVVVGFPNGYSAIAAKVEEIKRAIDEEVDELDVVINFCALKNGNWNYVRSEIDSLTTACHMRGKVIKVIVEAGSLTKEELLKVAAICEAAGVDFVKTSTGVNGPGASVEMVELLRSALPKSIKIKASGGIRDRKFAEELVNAGADRLGCSASLAIVGG